MVVGSTPFVAAILPTTNIAVFLRIWIDFDRSSCADCGLKATFHTAVVGCIVVHSEFLRCIVGPGRNDIAVSWAIPLNGRKQVRIQAELQNATALCLAGELGVDDFVGPSTKIARGVDLPENIRAPDPAIRAKRTLHD